MQPSYKSRKVTFTVFNRKELQHNKIQDSLTKYSQMDAYDNEKVFWSEMTSTIDPNRGYYSRLSPAILFTWKRAKDEDLLKIGTMIKRPLIDVVNEVKSLCKGSSENGYVNLNAIDWSGKAKRDAELKAQKEEERLAAEALAAEQAAAEKAEAKKIPIAAGVKSDKLVVKK